MDVPNNIKYILERIEKSEEEWKALYMAVWHYAGYIDAKYINKKEVEPEELAYFLNTDGTASVVAKPVFNTPMGGTSCVVGVISNKEPEETTIELRLPASRKGSHEWKIKELYSILSSRDGQFTVGHLQTLFSLFEELLHETAKTLFNLEINTGKWSGIEEFFKLSDFNNVLSMQEIKELKLSKETRNCFIHNGSKIDNFWLSAYQNARGTPPSNLEGKNLNEGLSNIFHEIEAWHDLIVNTAEKIKEKILQKN